MMRKCKRITPSGIRETAEGGVRIPGDWGGAQVPVGLARPSGRIGSLLEARQKRAPHRRVRADATSNRFSDPSSIRR
jgi:hypothetical protein